MQEFEAAHWQRAEVGTDVTMRARVPIMINFASLHGALRKVRNQSRNKDTPLATCALHSSRKRIDYRIRKVHSSSIIFLMDFRFPKPGATPQVNSVIIVFDTRDVLKTSNSLC